MYDCDRARKLQERENEAVVAYRKPEPAIAPVGWCHFCAELLNDDRLYCGAECATEHERMMRQGR